MNVSIRDLDDFGTGYANLVELRSWPIDTLKIDGSLVSGMQDSERDRAILEAIMVISDALGLRTVAEHVETSQQLALLRERGCHLAQGYLFARRCPQRRSQRACRCGGPPGCHRRGCDQ